MRASWKETRPVRLVQIVLLCLGITVALILSLQLWTLSARKIQELQSSRIDNIVWTTSQLEVEYLQLELSLKDARFGTGDPAAAADSVRRRFNVYYTRIETLLASPLYRSAFEETNGLEMLGALKERNDRLAPMIDAPDAELIANAGPLLEALTGIARDVRHVSSQGAIVGSVKGEKAREEVGDIMLRLSVVTAVLMVLLTMLAGLFFRLSQQNARRARKHRSTSVRLAEVLGTTPDALIVTDGDGRIDDCNAAAAHLLKLDGEKVIGRTFLTNLLDQAGNVVPLPFVTTGRVSALELDLSAADGTIVPVEVSQGVAEVGTDRFYVYFLRDISERQKAARALEESRDKALAGQRAKSRFLAVMSHEMRTPLNGILGLVELLRGNGTRSQKDTDHYLDLLQHSGQTLLNHVNDVLDIAHLEADGVTLSEAPFDFEAMMERLMAPMQVAAERRGNRLNLETVPDRLGWFIGDEQRLYQVLMNLVGNAVKYTENGEVNVTVTTTDRPGGEKVSLEVQVQDTGVGIAEEERDRIFEDFIRIEDNSRARKEGTGLGLGIAQRIVEAMGGEIGVESIPGEGSIFWFHVDLIPAQMTAPVRKEEDPGLERPVKGLSVLVVEDIATNRFVLRELLERDGNTVTEAVNGEKGVAAAQGTRFDVILMDINMPVMGGIEATRLIRQGGASRDSRIVAVTAHVFEQDKALFREAGMDAVVSKPVSRKSIRAVLNGDGEVVAEPRKTELLDKVHLSQLLRNLSPDRADRLVSGFLDEAPEVLTALEDADWDDAGNISQRVHALSGAAAIIGAHRFRNALVRLEDSLNNEQPQDLRGWAQLLEALWQETRGALQDFLWAHEQGKEG
ncbi:hybrid sensor histidine kinase/response regulator [Thalassovita mangrovi]|uniref:histidine kinase n=1 Tax=Thalassovita mangrovi TaxID=2692236 RepID=A0A6L8LCU1_9RHOB|nr:ATP-binding protein [Thalassovita mangrovi]MYM53831.1 response regulator [Thalassovita mangrovi]